VPVPAPSITRSVAPAPKKQATAEDRRRQMQQLLDLGVAIPEEYQAGLAAPGVWQSVSKQPAEDKGPEEDVKPSARATSGKKRKHDNDEEEERDGSVYIQRKGWGSRMKTYPKSGQVDDLDALLGAPIQLKSETVAARQEKEEASSSTEDGEEKKVVKEEEQYESSRINASEDAAMVPNVAKVEPEADAVPTGIVFKKRKSKLTKDKSQPVVDSK
jgi:hypothetical protein